jgi:hypothetical protein
VFAPLTYSGGKIQTILHIVVWILIVKAATEKIVTDLSFLQSINFQQGGQAGDNFAIKSGDVT